MFLVFMCMLNKSLQYTEHMVYKNKLNANVCGVSIILHFQTRIYIYLIDLFVFPTTCVLVTMLLF